MKSFLRWAGSKRQLLRSLRGHWPGNGSRYIEPFAGSACLFFHLEPEEAILGDLNDELICTLRAVQRDVGLVLQCLRRLPKGKSGYYAVRAMNARLLSDSELAARLIYLNHYCFNGLYRTNREGGFNVPYGPPKSGAGVDEELVINASRVLGNAKIISGDFENTTARARAGDFIYLDPPFIVRTRRLFSEYIPGSFSRSDLDRLALCLRTLDDKGATFLVSYADSPEARKLLAPWSKRRLWTRRNIAGFVGNRRGAYELIATNRRLSGESDNAN